MKARQMADLFFYGGALLLVLAGLALLFAGTVPNGAMRFFMAGLLVGTAGHLIIIARAAGKTGL